MGDLFVQVDPQIKVDLSNPIMMCLMWTLLCPAIWVWFFDDVIDRFGVGVLNKLQKLLCILILVQHDIPTYLGFYTKIGVLICSLEELCEHAGLFSNETLSLWWGCLGDILGDLIAQLTMAMSALILSTSFTNKELFWPLFGLLLMYKIWRDRLQSAIRAFHAIRNFEKIEFLVIVIFFRYFFSSSNE